MANFKKITILLLLALLVSYFPVCASAKAKNPPIFSINLKIPGYFYEGEPKIYTTAGYRENTWILKKKDYNIDLQLVIGVVVAANRSFYVIAAVDNAHGLDKYRGIYHHYKKNSDNVWVYQKVKNRSKDNKAIFFSKEYFINPGDIPLFCKELMTLTYSNNNGTENIVAGFKANVDSAAVEKWLLRAFKFTEAAIKKNRNHQK